MAPLRSLLLVGFLALQSYAKPTDAWFPPNSGPSSCGPNDFWYQTKECCLPHGGAPSPPPPPPNKSCPPLNWYWHPEKSCCVPKHPPKPNPPPPQCNNGWDWNYGTQCCEPGKPTPTTTRHHPSQTPPPPPPPPQYPPPGHQPPQYQPPYYPYPGGNNGGGDKGGYGGGNNGGQGGNYHLKRHLFGAESVCPNNLQACPMGHPSQKKFECVDTSVELRFCGGCPSAGSGQDCTSISGVGNVGCEAGTCAVYTCKIGYKLSSDRRSCVRY